jgi:two-component system, chemotaxis family, protein-glutamate methylesterase/glutaminase
MTRPTRTATNGSNRDYLHVLVVDDSATVRQVMQAILATDLRIKVTVAADPLIAFMKMAKELPDVVVTDLEMPHMDGLSFVRKIMAESPLPIVICSGLAASGTELALRALEEGAVEVISKPKLGVREFLHESAVRLLDTVWSAAQARLQVRPSFPVVTPKLTADAVLPPAVRRRPAAPRRNLVVVGASTGGTDALWAFLTAMPTECPPIVVVQHMPEGFTRAFAQRLNNFCEINVKEAQDGDKLQPGQALIAPGNFHTVLERKGAGWCVRVIDGALVSRHRPSVDVLFRSAAAAAGSTAVGVIMTGMGDDGAQGLKEMREAGAATIAQDEATCVVFGMPREAIARGAADFVLPLQLIAGRTLELTGTTLHSDQSAQPLDSH